MKTRMISMLALVAMVFGASEAFASRARVNVMGQGEAGFILNSTGSLYYDDMYNIFYNPAYVNDFKNWVIIEKGAVNNVNGAANAGHGEGGFVTSFMGVNAGVFLNRSDAFNFNNGANGGTVANGAVVRPIDVVIGGDHGVKWGLGLTYARSSGATTLAPVAPAVTGPAGTQSHMTARAGLMVADFAPFISYRFMGNSKVDDNNKSQAKDMSAGLKYSYGEWTPYGVYRMFKNDTTVGGTKTRNFDSTAWIAGAGRNTKLGENARLVYNIAYARLKAKDLGGTNQRSVRTVIPLDFALEADITSWMTVRGGLQYRITDRIAGSSGAAAVGGTTNVAGSVGDLTSARVGASFHVNKVDIDWAFGSNNTVAASAANLDTDTVGFDSGTFSNLSVSYKW